MQAPVPPPMSSTRAPMLPPPPPTFAATAGGGVSVGSSGGAIGEELYREAQEEITSLRTELYGTRRREWESREALTQARSDAEEAQGLVMGLQSQLEELRETAARVGPLQEANQLLNRGKAELEAEVAELQKRLEATQAELGTEQAARRRADEGRAKADSERSRLQRQRDEAHAQLRLATKRAEEAEEEQCRAEDEAAQSRAELQALRDAAFGTEGPDDGEAAKESARAQMTQLQAELSSERSRVALLTAALDKAKTQLVTQTEEATEAANGAMAQADALKAREAELLERETKLLERERLVAQTEATRVAENDITVDQLAEGTKSATLELRQGRQAEEQQEGQQPAAPVDDSAAQAKLQALEATVRRLTNVREKLLHEMDEQSSIADALSSENRALAQGLSEQRRLSAKWELQAQEGMLKAEQLKNMLAESAEWQTRGGGEEDTTPDARVRELEAKLLSEQAKVAELDLQVRTLTAELTKACQHTGELGRSMLPVLTDIESRMEQLASQSAIDLGMDG